MMKAFLIFLLILPLVGNIVAINEYYEEREAINYKVESEVHIVINN